MVEKRKSARFTIEIEIRWKRTDIDEDETGPNISWTRNLSTGGACLFLSPGVVPGDIVYLEIRLPNGESIYSSGRVAWVSTQALIKSWAISVYEGGIEFLNLVESEKALIDRCLSE